MDALPVTEQVDLPFKSTAKAMWNGQETGVMHACGHDNHMAILLGAGDRARAHAGSAAGHGEGDLSARRGGSAAGETGGAEQMVKENVLENPKVDAIFGLHVFPYPAGEIVYRSGPMMASADSFVIKVKGRQTHGAVPWGGIDPIVIGSQIVMASADDHQPHGEHHRSAGGRDRRPLHRRQPLEHRARTRSSSKAPSAPSTRACARTSTIASARLRRTSPRAPARRRR